MWLWRSAFGNLRTIRRESANDLPAPTTYLGFEGGASSALSIREEDRWMGPCTSTSNSRPRWFRKSLPSRGLPTEWGGRRLGERDTPRPLRAAGPRGCKLSEGSARNGDRLGVHEKSDDAGLRLLGHPEPFEGETDTRSWKSGEGPHRAALRDEVGASSRPHERGDTRAEVDLGCLADGRATGIRGQVLQDQPHDALLQSRSDRASQDSDLPRRRELADVRARGRTLRRIAHSSPPHRAVREGTNPQFGSRRIGEVGTKPRRGTTGILGLRRNREASGSAAA